MSKGLCRIAELTPSSEERLKRESVHLFSGVITQGACRRRRRMVRTKVLQMSRGERNIYGGVQGNCRRREQFTKLMLAFLEV